MCTPYTGLFISQIARDANLFCVFTDSVIFSLNDKIMWCGHVILTAGLREKVKLFGNVGKGCVSNGCVIRRLSL